MFETERIESIAICFIEFILKFNPKARIKRIKK